METFVIHVTDAFEREKHIKQQLLKVKLDAEFVLEGDKTDLTTQVLSTYFTGNRKNVTNSTSCVYKHILSYKRIVDNKIELALILEDDIIFYADFQNNLASIIDELKKEGLSNFIISLEDSLLQYINRSERLKNKMIYPKNYGRMAGAYLIDYEGAKGILEEIVDTKCHLPMDLYHNERVKAGALNIYWSQPTIAVQGSLKGSMATLIDNKTSGFFRVISFAMQRVYKKMLYYLR